MGSLLANDAYLQSLARKVCSQLNPSHRASLLAKLESQRLFRPPKKEERTGESVGGEGCGPTTPACREVSDQED